MLEWVSSAIQRWWLFLGETSNLVAWQRIATAVSQKSTFSPSIWLLSPRRDVALEASEYFNRTFPLIGMRPLLFVPFSYSEDSFSEVTSWFNGLSEESRPWIFPVVKLDDSNDLSNTSKPFNLPILIDIDFLRKLDAQDMCPSWVFVALNKPINAPAFIQTLNLLKKVKRPASMLFSCQFDKRNAGDSLRTRALDCCACSSFSRAIDSSGACYPCIRGIPSAMNLVSVHNLDIQTTERSIRSCTGCPVFANCPRCIFPYPFSDDEYCDLISHLLTAHERTEMKRRVDKR